VLKENEGIKITVIVQNFLANSQYSRCIEMTGRHNTGKERLLELSPKE